VYVVIHQGKGMESITEVTPVGQQDELRDDLERISVAYFYCELVNLLLPEKQEHRDVFILLTDALDALRNGTHDSIGGQSKTFALTLLRYLGFLESTRDLGGRELQTFIENITERRLRTPKLIRQIFANV
jgi:DNA repair protein RecO